MTTLGQGATENHFAISGIHMTPIGLQLPIPQNNIKQLIQYAY
jgi:hypothetical protein